MALKGDLVLIKKFTSAENVDHQGKTESVGKKFALVLNNPDNYNKYHDVVVIELTTIDADDDLYDPNIRVRPADIQDTTRKNFVGSYVHPKTWQPDPMFL
jgi:hypothetical protein